MPVRQDVKMTKISLREDYATGVSSSESGANIDGLAFNLNYITDKDPQIAELLMRIYEEVRELET